MDKIETGRKKEHLPRATLSRPQLFGATFSATFVLIEGLVASRTNWGRYTGPLSRFRIWRTPIYLIPIWGLFSTFLSKLAQRLSQKEIKIRKISFACFITTFLINLIGESLGQFFSLWKFRRRRITVLGVPLWIPFSYGAAFAVCPWLHWRRAGGIIQAVLVGVSWLVTHRRR